MALFLFDDYLCLRVDNLPENQIDIDLYFQKIGRAYELSWRIYQAFDYYKMALQTKGNFINADVG